MANIQSGSTADLAFVDANNQLAVVTSNVASNTGTIRMSSQNDPGVVTGSVALASPETSLDYRLRMGLDTVLFSATFNPTSQDTANWKHSFSIMTMTQSSGLLNINAAGTSTTAAQYCWLQSMRYFGLIDTAPLAFEFPFQITATPIAGEVFIAGFGVPVNAADPVDGVWVELTSAGLKICSRFNSGSTVKSSALLAAASINLNQSHKLTLVVNKDVAQLWIDDVLYGTLDTAAANGQSFISTTLPVFFQKYNGGTVGTSPNMIIKVSSVGVSIEDIATNMPWSHQMTGMGLGLQGLPGGTMGTAQTQWSNTALPTAAAATNTTAALGAFLAGIFQMNAPATSTTDVIVSSYQNPVGSTSQPARQMKIIGIRISCVNLGAAVATTPTTFAVALAWGASAVSLATTESASFATGTTKVRRIQPLGTIYFPVGAAIGQAAATDIVMDFAAPITINPGEFAQVIAKPLVGTATASQVIAWVIAPCVHHD